MVNLEKVIGDPRLYSQYFLKVRNKKGKLVPFIWSNTQRYTYSIMKWCQKHSIPPYFLILKSRQQFISTLGIALCFHAAATTEGVRCKTLAHTDPITKKLFARAVDFWDKLPYYMQPRQRAVKGNIRELDFADLGSTYNISTAGGGVGSGVSATLNVVHASELGNWAYGGYDLFSALLESIPLNYGLFLGESTAYRPKGVFYEKWLANRSNLQSLQNWVKGGQRGLNPAQDIFVPIFLPWYMNIEEYRMPISRNFEPIFNDEEQYLINNYKLDYEQINFRRFKKKECGADFNKWYPENDMTCFYFAEARGLPELNEKVHFITDADPMLRDFNWDSWTILGGIDFGAEHPFVYVKVAINKTDYTVYIFSEYLGTNTLTNDHINTIQKERWTNQYPRVFVADKSARQQRLDFKGAGINTYPSDSNREGGIDLLRWLMRTTNPLTGRPYFLINKQRCPRTCRQMLECRRTALSVGGFGDIVKKEDDAIDACRYPIYTFYKYYRREKYYLPWNMEVKDGETSESEGGEGIESEKDTEGIAPDGTSGCGDWGEGGEDNERAERGGIEAILI